MERNRTARVAVALCLCGEPALGQVQFEERARLDLDPLLEPLVLALGDLDGDGDPDMVVGQSAADRLYTNRHRALETPLLARVGRGFELQVFSRPGYASAPALAVIATAAGLLPAPVPLPGFGPLYLQPPLTLLPAVVVPSPAGLATHREPIPPAVSLVGTPFHLQAAVLAKGVWGLSAPSSQTIHP